jgi:crotonobetainyl-CoA:carnitine CoA-transferase CaiB-like acyl-CoA transferase
MSAPLSGFRLIELANFMAAPFAGMVLGDLGMDVVKVEPLGTGDHTRGTPPHIDGHSAGFLTLNRNKRSLALDLKHPRGRDVFLRLAGTADAILENYRPGTVGDLGVDYAAVKRVRPDVVYCSVSGFGQTGPGASRAGLDLVVQAESGLMSIMGHAGQPPSKVGVPIADLTAALYAANAIQAALIHRLRGGGGQYIDVSMLEGALSLAVWELSGFLADGRVPRPTGSAHRGSAPYQAFRTADGYVTLGATTPRLWGQFCALIGRPDLTADPRFADNAARVANQGELADEIERETMRQLTAHWTALLDEAGIPCGELRTYDQVLGAEHVLAREVLVTVPHPALGPVAVVGSPMRL